MEIRIACEDDYEHALELDKLVMGTDKRKQFLIQRIRHDRMYITVDGDRLVGFITFETNFIGCLYISLLVVHPDVRRRGVARRMIQTVARHSRNGKLFSSTEEDNDVSIQMHEALGFRRSGYIENLPQPSREIIYYKELSS